MKHFLIRGNIRKSCYEETRNRVMLGVVPMGLHHDPTLLTSPSAMVDQDRGFDREQSLEVIGLDVLRTFPNLGFFQEVESSHMTCSLGLMYSHAYREVPTMVPCMMYSVPMPAIDQILAMCKECRFLLECFCSTWSPQMPSFALQTCSTGLPMWPSLKLTMPW